MALASRVSEDVNQTVVIASGNQGSVTRECYMVNVCAIAAWREDAINEPAKLGTPGGPVFADCV